MKDVFQRQEGRVCIIDPSNAVRLELQAALRAVGFKDFEIANTVADAKKLLRSDLIDWIITPAFKNQSENIEHLLKTIDENAGVQKRPFVSVIVNPDELEVVPRAFELGLLSFHRRNIVREQLVSEFAHLLKLAQESVYESELVAAHYLRRFFTERKMFAELTVLEQAMQRFRPGEAKGLLRLAESYLQQKLYKEGISYLAQALVVEPNLLGEVEQLKQKFNTPEFEYQFKKMAPVFDISRCVVIDPDEAVHLALKPILTQLNIPHVEAFADGEEAWSHLVKDGEPDLLICEWKIPKVSGPAFIQRMRAKGLHRAPVMLLSSLVRESDAILVSELGIAKIVPKPVDVKQFVASLNQVLQQEKRPTEHAALERKILKHANLNQMAAARLLLETYKADSNIAESRKHYLAAEIFYAEGKYDEAKDEAIMAMKTSERDSLATTNVLGKCLMKMGDFKAALQFMQKAQAISPHNIDRMCAIAELQIATKNLESAHKTLDAARKIDAGNQQIAATEVNMALMTNNNARAQELLPQLSSPTQVISFMNTQAVSRIRSNQMMQGIELYKRTLGLLKDPAYDDVKAQLHYNLGLAYARQATYVEALRELNACIKLSDEGLKTKAQSLIRRINEALAKNKPLQLNLAEQKAHAATHYENFLNGVKPSLAAKVLKEVERARPEGACLRGLFKL